MIEMKTIPKECRDLMFVGFIHNSVLVWSKTRHLIGVCNKLIGDCGVNGCFKQELMIVLSVIQRCIKHNTGFKISMNRNHYSNANKAFEINISNTRMKELLLLLDDCNYITYYQGYYNSSDDSCISCVVVQDKMVDIFNKSNIKEVMTKELIGCNVEIVDKQNTIVTKRYNAKGGFMIKEKDVVLKDITQFKGWKKVQGDLLRYNTLLADTQITVDTGDGDVGVYVEYKRRFENNLKSCGRYYTENGFQNMKSIYRPTIKINGQPTVERDYATNHHTILTGLDGIILPDGFDAYTIPSLIDLGMDRGMIKSMFFPIMFSRDYGKAVQAIRLKLRECGLSGIKPETVIAEFTSHNDHLQPYFFQEGLYSDLQYYDSCIATVIINHFTGKGIPVLCYHDSFRIDREYDNDLVSVMFNAYDSVIGNTYNLVIR